MQRAVPLLLALAALNVSAQGWPAKPVRAIVPVGAGSSTDIVHRIVLEQVAEQLGQPMVVENRVGAGGTIGSAIVAKAHPDGYTLLASGAAHTIAPALYKSLPYDPLRDFSAVTLVGSVPNVLVLHPSVPAKTVKEFIAVAKARPGKLNFASTGNGTSQHLSAELFKFMAGLDMVHIPYKGTAPALTELVAGQVDLAFENMPALIPHIQAGRLRALAVTTTKRSAVMPELPTIAEAALPGYDASVWFGVFAPAGTPRPVVDRLHGEILKAMQTQDLKSRMIAMGTDVSGMGPDDFSAYVRKEIPKWANLVKAAGVKVSQ